MKIYIDGHCDTLTETYDNYEFINNSKYCFNIIDAKNMHIPVIQFAATFVDPKFNDGFVRATNVIDYFLNYNKNSIIKNRSDLEDIILNKKIGILLTIENGKAIENNIENIDVFYDKGIRVMSVNWNEDNLLGTGALTKKMSGLTKLGIEYVKKLEDKGIIIDISHSSEKTFWDVMKYTKNTIVATHSCCYSICNNLRNLKDNQIKEIARRNRNNRNLFL